MTTEVLNRVLEFGLTSQGILGAAAAQPEPSPWMNAVPMLLMFGIFYFFLIRPQSKARKEQETMIAALKTGDEVITSGGILGTVTNVKDKTVMVRVADNVKIELLKANVAQVQKPAETK